MSITVRFPDNTDEVFEKGKPIVVLGANGAGKTRFSVKIEEMNDASFNHRGVTGRFLVHRLSAQKSLSMKESTAIQDHESSTNALFIGRSDQQMNKTAYRFKSNPATSLLDDFNEALSLLFSEENRQLHEALTNDKAAVARSIERSAPITTVVDQAVTMWNELLPLRKIDLSGNGVHVKYKDVRYHGKEMSDGERVMLYMICQVLVLKPDSLLIIDEPELHIHKAIVTKLWDKLEATRRDCVFMYITHDIPFALSRNTEKILWIKDFNGTDWNYDFLGASNISDLPDELLYEIIGTRQKILFVEGNKNSFDHSLYQEIYRDKGYHVIPCGGCQDVIKYVKSKRAYDKLNSIEVFGIIDRDFRTDFEILALERDGVYCLKVAEVENLFVVPRVLDILEGQFGCPPGKGEEARDLIRQLFSQNKDNQIGEALIKEIKHQLTLIDFNGDEKTSTEIKNHIDREFSAEKIQEFYETKKSLFEGASTPDEILKCFNFKELGRKIGPIFGIRGNEYYQKIINLLRQNPNAVRNQLIGILEQYLPELP